MATEHLAVVLELMTGQYQREARAAATSSDRLAQSTGEAARTTDRMGSAAVTAGQKIARSEGEYHDLARSIAKSTRDAAELDEELIQLGRSFDLNEKEARQFAQSMKRAAADTNDAAVATDVATAKFETNASKIRGGLATLGIGLGVAEVGRFFMDSVRDAAELEQASGRVAGSYDLQTPLAQKHWRVAREEFFALRKDMLETASLHLMLAQPSEGRRPAGLEG